MKLGDKIFIYWVEHSDDIYSHVLNKMGTVTTLEQLGFWAKFNDDDNSIGFWFNFDNVFNTAAKYNNLRYMNLKKLLEVL